MLLVLDRRDSSPFLPPCDQTVITPSMIPHNHAETPLLRQYLQDSRGVSAGIRVGEIRHDTAGLSLRGARWNPFRRDTA